MTPNGAPAPEAPAPPLGGAPDVPTPTFAVRGVAHEPHAATPTLRFAMGIDDPSGREVYTIALSAQIHIEPAARSHSPETRERLLELFGVPERWGSTARSLIWTRVGTLVPSFRGATAFTLDVPCTYDLEVAASRYLEALPDGEAPLTFHLSGTVLWRSDDGRIQATMVPWDCSVPFRMPVEAWGAMMAQHHPHGGWVRLHRDTLERLQRAKADRGLPSLDVLMERLLEEAGRGA